MILKHTSVEQWNYVPTQENPADMGTRPLTPAELKSTCWFSGPTFLHTSEPIERQNPVEMLLELPETVDDKPVMNINLRTDVAPYKYLCYDIANKTNDWGKAVSIMQCALALVDKIKQKSGIQLAPRSPTRSLAVKRLVENAQKSAYGTEIDTLSAGGFLPNSNALAKFSPFLDHDGTMRVGGRLTRSAIPYNLRHPIVLPKGHPISLLVLHHYHHKTMHAGRHITHGALRDAGYFLVGGHNSIRSLVKNCVICRALRAPLRTQFMSALPTDRLEEVPPFTNVGMDVFGPYHIYDGTNTRKKAGATKKMWALLFTCLCSRAIHIEPLYSMDTNSLQNALRRFWGARGTCKRIRSDRGTNFLATKNQLQSSVNLDQLKKYASSQEIEWEFTTAGASSHGGVWERKVGAIKNVMSSSMRQLGERVLSRDELVTLFQEASANANDPVPLTPAMLLTLKDQPNSPPPEQFTKDDLLQYGKSRWRRVQYLADQFWSRWRTHYLHTLQARHKWTQRNHSVNIGDVVLLNDKSKRHMWPVAVIIDVKKSRDGLVRSVTIKLPSKNNRAVTYERALHDTVLLIPSSNI